MIPRLVAIDLDGTLLTGDKRLSRANIEALDDMHQRGVHVALASGRIGSSMMRYAQGLDFDVAMITLNGAAVYASKYDMSTPLLDVTLDDRYSRLLLECARARDFALNFYHKGALYSLDTPRTRKWTDLYVRQTSSRYHFVPAVDQLQGLRPSKILFVGDEKELDEEEVKFRALWDGEIYIVRTWEYYLEFLHRDAHKGNALAALARHFGVAAAGTLAFGDSDNDAPMLEAAGLGIAVRNATTAVKNAADRVSDWSNDEDCVAREWRSVVAAG